MLSWVILIFQLFLVQVIAIDNTILNDSDSADSNEIKSHLSDLVLDLTRNRNPSGNEAAGNTAEAEQKLKNMIYRRILLKTFSHHQIAKRKLLDVTRIKGFTRSDMKHWLQHITGPGILLRILQSLKNDPETSLIDLGHYSLPRSKIFLRQDFFPNDNFGETETKTASNVTYRDFPQSNTSIISALSPPLYYVTPKKRNYLEKPLFRLLSGALMEPLKTASKTADKRIRRSQEGIMYLPIGGTKKIQCPTAADAAGVSISQIAFLSICLTVFSIIVNISNNINNNNNNNNINTDNNLSNNNAQLSLNVNNAAQVNVMLPPPVPGRKRRNSMRDTWRQSRTKATHDDLEEMLQKLINEDRRDDENNTVKSNDTRVIDGKLFTNDPGKILTNTSARSSEKDGRDKSPRHVYQNRKQATKSIMLAKNTTKQSIYQSALTNPEASHSHKDQEFAGNTSNSYNPFSDFDSHPDYILRHFHGLKNQGLYHESSDRAQGGSQMMHVSLRFTKSIGKWLQYITLGPVSCQGLHICRQLPNQIPGDSWMDLIGSFVFHSHEKSGWSIPSLREFFRRAVKDRQCPQLFPSCSSTQAL